MALQASLPLANIAVKRGHSYAVAETFCMATVAIKSIPYNVQWAIYPLSVTQSSEQNRLQPLG